MGNELLMTARAWISAHGADVMMPRGDEITETYGDRRFYHASTTFLIRPDEGQGDGIRDVPGRLIPFLAGLELGLSDEALAEILKHHGADLFDINRPTFSGSMMTCLNVQSSGKQISASEVHIRFYSAMKTIVHVSDLVQAARRGKAYDHLALLHLNSPSVWADTMITERLAGVYQNSAYAQHLSPDDFGAVIERVMTLDDLPNRSIAEFIDRSGMLNEGVITKRLDRHAHWELLMERLCSGSDIASQIFEYLCAVTDKKQQASVLKAVLSLESCSTRLTPAKVMRQLSWLPESCYLRAALSSNILKINLLDSNYWEAEEPLLKNGSYSELLSRPELILSKVAKEILAIKPAQMGFSHFTAFARMSFMNLQPQVIDFRPEALLNHLFDAYDMFKKPEKCTGLEVKTIDDLAMTGIETALILIAREHTLDPEVFNHRSAEEKVMMVKAGVNPKGFTGFDGKHKSQILEDAMGL
jgi:hypothetical protein